RPRAGEQFVDQLVGQPVTYRRWELDQRGPCGGRAAPAGRSARPPGSLRSPLALSRSAASSNWAPVLLFADMTIAFGHAYTNPRTLPQPQAKGAAGWSVRPTDAATLRCM